MPVNYRGLDIPFVSFGSVTSDDLFSEKEQDIFDFFEEAGRSKRYRRALDIGANIGVHSCLMIKAGWQTKAFEPDPDTHKMLLSNLRANCGRKLSQNDYAVGLAAVSDHDGTETFVRVLGNTTGSHLKGDKEPYGELEEFEVAVVDCRPLFDWADVAKIDCEGHEARLLLTVTPEQRCEFMVEIGNSVNATAIFCHFHGKRGMWAQKSGWGPVRGLSDMPTHHSDGAVFIGWKEPFP